MHLLLMDTVINRLIASLCRTLIHSFWQGLLLIVITTLLLTIAGKQRAAIRYNLVLTVFSLFLIGCGCSFVWQWNHVNDIVHGSAFAGPLTLQVPGILQGDLQTLQQLLDRCNEWLTRHDIWLVAIWVIILSAKLVKTICALWYNSRTTTRSVLVPDEYWQQQLLHLKAALRIKKTILLMESARMKIPVVIGHLKPVMLMPAGLLLSLPPDQAEAILLHELAHIRRNDYLVNLLQHFAETLFFFNPAVLWVSAWLREEREKCCDEIAVAQTHDKKGLVAALISFKQWELYGKVYQTAFHGKKEQLLHRVNHILGNHAQARSFTEKICITACFLLLAVSLSIGLAEVRHPGTPGAVAGAQNNMGTSLISHNEVADSAMFAAVGKRVHKINAVRKKAKQQTIPQELNAAILVSDEQVTLSTEQKQPALHTQMAGQDMLMAKVRREQAFQDYEKAMIDQVQARKDQEEAIRTQQEAMHQQQQARIDQEKAAIDQQRAYINFQKNMQDKKEAERQSSIILKLTNK